MRFRNGAGRVRTPLYGPQYHKERVVVAFELGPLVCAVGILDGEIVQAKLVLDLLQQVFTGSCSPIQIKRSSCLSTFLMAWISTSAMRRPPA